MRGARAVRRCASFGVVMLLAGCNLVGEQRPDAVDRSTGPLADAHYQWTAGPEIDLVRGPAVPVRAFIESRLDAQYMNDLDYAYPGFNEAVAEVSTDGDEAILTQNLRPDTERGSAPDATRVGDNRFSIQSITRTGDTVIATVCNFRYGLALEQDNGTFVSVAQAAVDDDGIDAMRIRMSAPTDQPDQRLPAQEGPAVAPTTNVFGDWKITGFLVSYGGPEAAYERVWPSQAADLARCVADAPDAPERRASLIAGQHPRADFPTSPPSPGWPERKEG